MDFSTPSPQDDLAKRIATALDDTTNLTLYLHYCRKYPSSIILRAFNDAINIPENRIKKNRAAIFFYSIKLLSNSTKRQNPI